MALLQHPSAPPARERIGVWLLRGLAALGIAALFFYFSWWRSTPEASSLWIAVALVLVTLYSGVQIVGSWLLYLAARRPLPAPKRPQNLSVDVLVTACHEPRALVEPSLRAACALRGAHRTWLLDDGGDPDLERLAKRLGAGYLTRGDHRDAKAGNVNAALPRTSGDILVIFDIDHVPEPDFLERTLGHFADPRVGFVQVMITFSNSDQSWVAQAAAETSLDFYNPTSLGMDALGGVTMMGSNALIRRSALVSIGGYRAGLAEDLATSVALHAAGWRSAYVAEPLAPGLAPSNIAAWFTQQLKWARGVFELLLTVYPRVFPHLTWGQRLCYAVRMTKYWIGPVIAVHLFLTIGVVWSQSPPSQRHFEQYLLFGLPFALMEVLNRQVAMLVWRHPSTPPTSLWRAVALVYFSWPVYLLAWLMAMFRVPLAFRPTPKSANGSLNPIWMVPQVTTLLLLLSGIVTLPPSANGFPRPILLGFAALQGGLQLLVLCQRLRPHRIKELLADARAAKAPDIDPQPQRRQERLVGPRGEGLVTEAVERE